MNNQISIEMPSYIFPYRSTRHSNNNNLTVSMENNESVIRPFGNSFFPSTISIWNSIPDDIKSIPSETLFLYLRPKAIYGMYSLQINNLNLIRFSLLSSLLCNLYYIYYICNLYSHNVIHILNIIYYMYHKYNI